MKILGIDIGGTSIKTVLTNEKGKFDEKSVESFKTSENILPVIRKILEKYTPYCEKIGISIAANVNSKGVIVNSTNLNIEKNFPLTEWAKKITRKPCKAVNDGTASAFAVLGRKEFKTFSNILSVTLGTGIGGGVIVNRKVLLSKTGIDTELGHITVVKDGKQCLCGNKGCVEAYCGEKSIVERFNKVSSQKISTALELKNLEEKGDKTAKKIIAETGEYLGAALVSVSNILGIEAIVLGGGVAGLGATLEKTISSYLRKNCFGSKLGIYPKVFIVKNNHYLSLEGAIKLWHE